MSAAIEAIFITGGSSGLGLELAGLFLADGYTVGACSIEEPEAVAGTLPPGVRYYQADVTDAARMQAVVAQFAAEAGRLDILVANAGISMPKASVPDFDLGRKVIEINVLGVLNSFAPAIPVMQAQGRGQLVALGSIAGFNGLPGTAIYGASKAAVLKLCESFAIDLADAGISVTALAPGFIATPLTQHNRHKMPFLMTQREAALRIQRAIRQKKALYVFPFPMYIIASLLALMPRSLYRAFMQRDYLGLRG